MKESSNSQEKKRKNIDLLEIKLFQLNQTIKKELESGTDLANINLKNVNKEDCGNFVQIIISKGKFYAKAHLDLIKYFLNKYTKYGYFEGDKDFFLTKLSTSMHIESFPKDYLLFRKNDIGDKFYIILKGKVAIVINQDIFIDMTQREYYIHFEKLRYFKEYYLLERLLSYENKIDLDPKIVDETRDEIYLELIKQRKLGVKYVSSFSDISPQKFVERVEPIANKKAKEPRINVKIPIYKIVAYLNIGDTFGEIALSKIDLEERKRTATVITDSECVFGIVPNSIYSTFLKEVEEKTRYILVTQLVSHSLFKSIIPETFLKANFLNYFNNMMFKSGTYFFKQGEEKSALFFIFNGVINLYTQASIDNIINIIEHLNNDIGEQLNKENENTMNNINKIKDETFKGEIDIIKDFYSYKLTNNLFNKFCKLKKTFKIFSINTKETLGFDDCILNENKYFLTAKVMYDNCHVFVLKLNFLKTILKENIIQRNYRRTNLEKKKIMINRLSDMVKMLMARFLKKNEIIISEIHYDEPKKKIDKSILKSENISYKEIRSENEKISKSKSKGRNKKFFPNLKTFGKNLNKKIKNIKKKNLLSLDKYLFEKKLEKEKYKTLNNFNKKILFKNRLINIHINFSNENIPKSKKLNLPFVNKIDSIQKTNYQKSSYRNDEHFKTQIKDIKSEDDINKLIPDIKKLSTKYMINEFDKMKRKINNMTQSDFIFFDNFFVSRGKQQYSKEPLKIDI